MVTRTYSINISHLVVAFSRYPKRYSLATIRQFVQRVIHMVLSSAGSPDSSKREKKLFLFVCLIHIPPTKAILNDLQQKQMVINNIKLYRIHQINGKQYNLNLKVQQKPNTDIKLKWKTINVLLTTWDNRNGKCGPNYIGLSSKLDSSRNDVAAIHLDVSKAFSKVCKVSKAFGLYMDNLIKCGLNDTTGR